MKSKRSPSFSRLRVAVIIIAALAFGLAAVVSRADEAPAPPLPKMLVVADYNVPGYPAFTSATMIWSKDDADEDAAGELTNKTNGPCGRPYLLAPAEVEVIRDLKGYLCEPKAFELIPAPDNVEALSLIHYTWGDEEGSFSIGPIGAVKQGSPEIVGPLNNDEHEAATITTFVKSWTPMKVTIYGPHFTIIAVELFAAESGVLPSQYRIQTQGSFFVEVSIGWQLPGKFDPVYGFASSGTARNGNFRSYPFGKE